MNALNDYLSRQEAVQLLGTARSSFHYYVNTGAIRPIVTRTSARLLYPREQVERLAAARPDLVGRRDGDQGRRRRRGPDLADLGVVPAPEPGPVLRIRAPDRFGRPCSPAHHLVLQAPTLAECRAIAHLRPDLAGRPTASIWTPPQIHDLRKMPHTLLVLKR